MGGTEPEQPEDFPYPVFGRFAYRLSASDKHYFWSLCWDEGVG